MTESDGIICKCGHTPYYHWQEDALGGIIIESDGTGPCHKFIRTGHFCEGCGDGPENYCSCLFYSPDNLTTIEKIAKDKGLV